MIGTKILQYEITEQLGEVPIRLDLATLLFYEKLSPFVGLSISRRMDSAGSRIHKAEPPQGGSHWRFR